MATWKDRLRAGAAAAALLGLSGCGKPAADTGPADRPAVGVADAKAPPANAASPAPPEAGATTDAKYLQPFEQAAFTEEVPEGQQLPPDRTRAGKPTGPLRVAVEKLWPRIGLTDVKGAAVPFVATLDTDAGPVEITLRPEWAPNHVRNFIALSKVGYYDGLAFDRVIRQVGESDDGKSHRLDLVKAGCPLGTGDYGIGHIGYFLKPEFSGEVKHEEGTVGFWHDDHPASAGCRFYVTLGPAPLLDGQFTVIGKVTKGLDAVKKIAAGPVLQAEQYPENEKPVSPVAIRKVTVSPDPVERMEAPVVRYNQPR